jgi:hypothetical protein
METIYLVCLLVGGFFVLLSIFGGAESGADTDVDLDGEMPGDFDHDVAHYDMSVGEHDLGHGSTAFVDLLSVRALFLFAAFFGLTGELLSLLDTGEPMTVILSTLVGLAAGLGGNYVIKRVGYDVVSSDLSSSDLKGASGRVLIPFEGARKGKISLVAKGQRLQLVARAFENQTIDSFRPGDDVVVVRMDGAVAEVVKPE